MPNKLRGRKSDTLKAAHKLDKQARREKLAATLGPRAEAKRLRKRQRNLRNA